MTEDNFIYHAPAAEGHAPIKRWTKGVPVEDRAAKQLADTASLPFIYRHLAVMPDVHLGMGATVGSVVPTKDAIIPAAVGVDIGCGMMAVKTTLKAEQLPDSLAPIRREIEARVPHGRTGHGGKNDRGAWGEIPDPVSRLWSERFEARYKEVVERHPKAFSANNARHMGTLGTGNHFVEVCLDEQGALWIMLHSGSRGLGNKIGTYFIERAKKDMRRWFLNLPNQDLAYLPDGSQIFGDYIRAVGFAQDYAKENRNLMMQAVLAALRAAGLPDFEVLDEAINCHHNYVAKEEHFGQKVWITRKGAVRTREGDLGIIPGSMGAESFIVRGKGHAESFCSCSHGAGRVMSRTEARRRFTLKQHAEATEGVECWKDAEVIDETPGAYKDIDAVMAAQSDLIEVVATLKQIVCVKG